MVRLPAPGADDDAWGVLLNEFLRVAHHEDGRLRDVAPALNVMDFGAAGDGRADDYAALLRAQASAGGRAIHFPPGRYRIARSVTVDAPLAFTFGARLLPDPGVTVTIGAGGILAPPHATIFEVQPQAAGESAARVVRARWGGRLYANWWSGADIGECWNAMVRAVTRTGNSANDPTPRLFAIAPGAYLLRTPMDLTRFRSGQHFDFRGAQLFADMEGRCALDLTGSSGCTLWGPHLSGIACAIGLLESRPEDDPATMRDERVSSGKQTIIAPQIGGLFTIAAYYNCAAEESKIFGGVIANIAVASNDDGESEPVGAAESPATFGRYAAYWGRQIHPDDLALVRAATPHSRPGNGNADGGSAAGRPPQSATGYNVFGTQIRGTTVRGTIYVWGFSRLSLASVYVTAKDGPHVTVDASRWSCLGLFADELYCHGELQGLPRVCIEIIGASPNIEITQLHLRARQIVAEEHAVRVGPTTLDSCIIEFTDVLLDRTADPQDRVFLGIHCDGRAHWVDSQIRVRSSTSTPISLGDSFVQSELTMGDLGRLQAATHMRGSVVRGTSGLGGPPVVHRYGAGGTATISYDGYTTSGRIGSPLGDADTTLAIAGGTWYLLPAATLNAPRRVRLASEGAAAGSRITLVCEDLSGHPLEVLDLASGATLVRLPRQERDVARFAFDGARWALHEYTSLGRPV